jgi:DNA-binding NtrC family response regulator
MTTTLVIGSDESTIEGIAQALAAAGHRVHVTRSIAEAAAVLAEIHPVAVLVERTYATDAEFQRLRLSHGSALILYRADARPAPALGVELQRQTLADLVLPWERQRLLAIVQRLTERAVAAGRTRRDTPPESHPG